MPYYCRVNLLDSSGHLIGSDFKDVSVIASGTNFSVPTNFIDALAFCSSINPLYEAIDGIMTYSGGSSFTAGVDWPVVYQGFSYAVALFMIGAGCGLLLNVVRKAK